MTSLDLGDNASIGDAGARELYALLDERTQITKCVSLLSVLCAAHRARRCVLDGSGVKDAALRDRIAQRLERNRACARILDECLLQLRYPSFTITHKSSPCLIAAVRDGVKTIVAADRCAQILSL